MSFIVKSTINIMIDISMLFCLCIQAICLCILGSLIYMSNKANFWLYKSQLHFNLFDIY